MNLSPKTLAVSAGGLLILVFLIAWITGDTSDPGKKQDDLAFLDEPISDSPFLDDFGTPPSINDAPPEELDPETSIAKNEPPAQSQASPVAGDGEAILIKPKRPLPGKSKVKRLQSAIV